jgi:hypothetical protein
MSDKTFCTLFNLVMIALVYGTIALGYFAKDIGGLTIGIFVATAVTPVCVMDIFNIWTKGI